jgi:hypothetical protein
MYNITLVFTAHLEMGKCNSMELYNILIKISPEIIFEEISNDRYDAYYNEKSFYTLETDAINMYLQNHKIEHIPVDTYDFPDIREEVDYFHTVIEKNSKEYCELVIDEYNRTIEDGFLYINSKENKSLIEKLHIIEKGIVEKFNNENLSRIYKLWNEINNKREDVILKNIYDFSYRNKYDKALLLIGAEHRKSILKKIEKYKMQEEIKLNWKLYES